MATDLEPYQKRVGQPKIVVPTGGSHVILQKRLTVRRRIVRRCWASGSAPLA